MKVYDTSGRLVTTYAIGGTPSTQDFDDSPDEGTSEVAARSDHVHGMPSGITDIDDFLENPPTEDEAHKAPTSEWAYDHANATLSASVHPNSIPSALSSAFGYQLDATNQIIPTTVLTPVILDAESFDYGTEFNITKVTGTATSTSSGKLVDSNAHFQTDGVLANAYVWNTTDNTYSYVNSVDSETQLTLADNIMASGEGYIVFLSRFTVTTTGLYLIIGSITFLNTEVVADKRVGAYVYKNRATLIGNSRHQSSVQDYISSQFLATAQLTAGDYLTLSAFHTFGSNATVYATYTADSNLQVSRLI